MNKLFNYDNQNILSQKITFYSLTTFSFVY